MRRKLARFAALGFYALRPKGLKRQDGILSAYQVHDIFLVWGGDAPNPFRSISFHSTLPASGRVKQYPDGLRCQDIVLLGATGNYILVLE